MPNVAVLDMKGTKVDEINLADSIFGIEPNAAVMHDLVVNYLANQRQGTQSALTRSEVRGGGRKPWRQKGTGHARQGSIRAPQWTKGGVVFAPKPRDYSYTVNKKVRRLAMKSAFSTKAQDNDIIVIDSIKLDDYKTKSMINMLEAVGSEKKALIVLPEVDKVVIKSAANIPGVKTAQVNELNVYDMQDRGGVRIMAAQDIIIRPIITEKSMIGATEKKYTFEVAKKANKIEIAKAVEEIFGVKVSKVNTINVRGRLRRQGRNQGYTRSWKKAYVTLTQDSKNIEFFEGMM